MDKQPGAELNNDSISDDKKESHNHPNKFIVKDSLNQDLLSSQIEEDGISESIRVLGEEDFEDDSEPVLVRPVPTDLPEDSVPKRKPSFEGKHMW